MAAAMTSRMQIQPSGVIIRRKTNVLVKGKSKHINDLEVLDNGDIVAVRYGHVQLLDSQLNLKPNFAWPGGGSRGALMAARTRDSNIAVCRNGDNEVFIFDINGNYLCSIHNGLFSKLLGVRMNSCGELVLIDGLVVRHIDYNTGDMLTSTKPGLFVDPCRVTTNSKDIVIVTDYGAHCIKAIDRHGKVQFKYGSQGSGQLYGPMGVCCDQYDNIITADCLNDRVTLLNATGQFIKHLLTAQDGLKHPLTAQDGLKHPVAVAVDNAGLLLVGTEEGDIYTVQYQQ